MRDRLHGDLESAVRDRYCKAFLILFVEVWLKPPPLDIGIVLGLEMLVVGDGDVG